MIRRLKNIVTAVLIMAIFCVELIPMGLSTRKNVVYAASKLQNPFIQSGVTTWDCIYFGNYYQSNSMTKEPIKWRVLNISGNDAFLLADKNLDCKRYHEYSTTVTWVSSSLRAWLNGSFLAVAFSGDEKKAIQPTNVGDSAGSIDSISLLTPAEASNQNYGFDTNKDSWSATRRAFNTTYAVERGAKEGDISTSNWWLRTQNESSSKANDVGMVGCIYPLVYEMNLDGFCVRPCLHLDLSKTDLWSYAGTVDSNGKVIKPEVLAPTLDPTLAPTPAPTVQASPTITPIPTTIQPSVDKYTNQFAIGTCFTNGSLKYKVTNIMGTKGSIKVIAPISKKLTKVVIPEVVNRSGITFKVTTIQSKAFMKCKKLKKITIKSKYLTSIGKKAFRSIGKNAAYLVPKRMVKKYSKMIRKAK